MKIAAADLFCGAGGTSTGMGRACRDLGIELDLLAVNHWPVAIETHSRNHPAARHLCESLDGVNPRQVIPSGRLHLLVASPECTHHSRARGGKPKNDQSRASAWHVPRWLEALDVKSLIVENVVEFMEWGPLGSNGKPLKSRKGETFKAWIGAIESLGYRVEYKTLCAADYGDPTTRERLFVLARKGRGAIEWPEPTHGKHSTLLRDVKPWRAAREVIDWQLPGQSIFNRKRPLSPNTLRRIVEGLRRFGGKTLEPFLMHLTHGGRVHDVARPFPTITGAHRGELAVVEPFLLSQASGGAPRRVSEPMPTVCGDGATALVSASFIVSAGGPEVGPRSVDQPLNTTLTRDHMAIVQPFLTKYYGTALANSVDEPLDTITTRDRFGLCTPLVVRTTDGQLVALDIRFRMLQPHELAAGMSFDRDYHFAGNKGDQIKQIGNAVPGECARALCRAQLAPFAEGRRTREERAA